jgi:hypothetical protein
MYGKVVSSNGLISLTSLETEKVVTFEKALEYLCVIVEAECYLTLNNDTDKIYLPLAYSQPFILDQFPIYKIKVEKVDNGIIYDDTSCKFQFSYYGYY